MASSESNSAVVLELAEEFLQRYRQGKRPSLKEYIDRRPDLAAEIREVFPAMAMMENIALADESLAGKDVADRKWQPPELLTQLGDYRIIREVGRGGMGVVYEAEQVSLGRHVALKVLPSKALPDARQKRRFEREAKAAARLHHTNIVPVFGVGEQDGLPYYVMQFIQGLGMNEVLRELQRLQAQGVPATSGALPVSRKDITAADVARSLLTGHFAFDAAEPEPHAGAQTVDQPDGVAPRAETDGLRSASDSGLRSDSSLVLPGQSAESASKKQTYWQSIATIGVQIASALDYAHHQGILHRDIKPSNLLLDTRGTVWVTDFGLAKADDQENLTHTGDILGTLRYMPPEAFEGRADRRSDVYSLGLTLYEMLALRPAFDDKGRNQLIKQVTTREPLQLGTLNPAAPRDLVTIVHKAIDRDPGQRYQTAAELAADLRRFLDDEPIHARRLSSVERCGRWCRRNPALATALAALALSLLLGTIVATTFAVQSDGHARQALHNEETAKRNEADAKRNEAAAVAAQNDLRKANAAIIQQQEQLEKLVARSLLLPLGLQDPGQVPVPLIDEEIEVLWDLAGNPDQRVWYRFVEEAVNGSGTTRQLKNRAALAWQAAVGLDLKKRAKVEDLLRKRLGDEKLDQTQRIDLVLAAVDLGLTPAAARAVADVLIQAMRRTDNPNTLLALAQRLDQLAGTLEADEAAQRYATVSASLTQSITKTTDPKTVAALAQSLSAVTARLEAKEVAKHCAETATVLIETMKKTTEPNTLAPLAQSLSAVAAHLESKEAAQVATLLIETMQKTGDDNIWSALAQGLSAVAARLESKEAAQVATLLIETMQKIGGGEANPWSALAQGLSAVAARLESKEAAQVATLLIETMQKTANATTVRSLAQGLPAVAARLQSKEAAKTATLLIETMKKTTDPNTLYTLAYGLSAVAARLKFNETAKYCAEAATLLTETMKKTTDPNTLSTLAHGLAAVAARLEAQEEAQWCAKAANMLIQRMKKTTDHTTQINLANALLKVAGRLEAKDAAQTATVLAETMNKDPHPDTLYPLAQSLWAVTARLEAAQAATLLIETMKKTTDDYAWSALAQGLSAVAARLEAQEAAQWCAKVANMLIQDMKKTTDPDTQIRLTNGLLAVAARLEAKEAAQTATVLTEIMKKTADPNTLYWLAQGLSAVAARLEAKEAAQAATVLIETMKKTAKPKAGEPDTLPALAGALAAVAARLEPAQGAALLTETMKKTSDLYTLLILAQGLSALAARLEPAQGAMLLTETMKKTTDPNTLSTLAQGLSAVAGRLQKRAAALRCAEAATLLTQTMIKTADPDPTCLPGLEAVAAHLEVKEAAEVAALLTAAMKKTSDANAQFVLARGLAAIAPRLKERDAAHAAAAMLIHAGSKLQPVPPDKLQPVPQDDLSAFLGKLDSTTVTYRAQGVIATVAILAQPSQAFSLPALLGPALEPLPRPLPPPVLVELLKNPLCVGDARRAVLDVLEIHYQRHFADQWDFVRYAQDNNLGLDLTSPPKRTTK